MISGEKSYRCYSDMVIPAFWHPQTRNPRNGHSLLILPLRFGLELGLGLQGMSISLGFREWGCPYHCRLSKSPSSDFIWRGTKDFSYLIGANFTDPKTGRCAWTNQSSPQGPLGIKLSLTSTKSIETTCGSNSNMGSIARWKVNTTNKLVIM